jgi:hypothetical protein
MDRDSDTSFSNALQQYTSYSNMRCLLVARFTRSDLYTTKLDNADNPTSDLCIGHNRDWCYIKEASRSEMPQAALRPGQMTNPARLRFAMDKSADLPLKVYA